MTKQEWTILRSCGCLYCALCVFSSRDCDGGDDGESGTGGVSPDHSNSSLFVFIYHGGSSRAKNRAAEIHELGGIQSIEVVPLAILASFPFLLSFHSLCALFPRGVG